MEALDRQVAEKQKSLQEDYFMKLEKSMGKISLENILINLWLKLEKSIMKEHFME